MSVANLINRFYDKKTFPTLLTDTVLKLTAGVQGVQGAILHTHEGFLKVTEAFGKRSEAILRTHDGSLAALKRCLYVKEGFKLPFYGSATLLLRSANAGDEGTGDFSFKEGCDSMNFSLNNERKRGDRDDLLCDSDDMEGVREGLEAVSDKKEGGSEALTTGSNDLMVVSDEMTGGSERLMTGSNDLMGVSDEMTGGSEGLMTGSNDLTGVNDEMSGGSEGLMAGSEGLMSGSDVLNDCILVL